MNRLKRILVLFFVLTLTLPSMTAYAEQVLLKQGVSGDSVLNLQTKLKNYGYYQGELDGAFGPNTRTAVINFQTDCGLQVDGVAGTETLKALSAFKATGIQVNRGSRTDREAQAILATARKYLGVKYKWSGNSPSGFDCSGFVYYVFSQNSVSLPRTSYEQFKTGIKVSKLQTGDLVFFSTYASGASHAGIYIGNNQFIHSSSGAGEVTITPLSTPYYSARYLGARRVL